MEHPDAANVEANVIEQNKQKHPIALIFHITFKALAIVWYIVGRSIVDGFVMSFIVQVLLLAIDFWIVKNVTGRLLVGLRYWNDIKEDGSTEWRFESRPDLNQIVDSERRIFWIGLVLTPLIWILLGIFALLSILSFKPIQVIPNILIVFIALGLTLPNVYGYMKCSKESTQKIRDYAQSYIGNAAINAALRRV